jgi:hypothetical protein
MATDQHKQCDGDPVQKALPEVLLALEAEVVPSRLRRTLMMRVQRNVWVVVGMSLETLQRSEFSLSMSQVRDSAFILNQFHYK